ncbi:uncharacterized protein NFIA_085470 [Aspergillus fischeri NRRL 181]|uniref:Uncharacterized protein n=1 Tax=Neosartorya fischeri (strain ATCC 1020 / DSM 3700 / CBS 544.65 / FGSC A1164 / JCM 1740 / NRRL 181 / WB 181) TaxID=331117 RepID=A1DGT6_NEOFI|nr:conserved hypothetical protein [Aspergillus fischeri NRRL 181]EAW18593.1 conserved hypothetical protein [Aspergillus fischeri NRRL 181]KAG2007622.1 hypothetical protein GB937_008433 [Aspergillus fischeri]
MADRSEADIPTDVPPFARPLAPYIRTRQEALRIRQALTYYLRSQIDFAEDDSENPNCHSQSHLSLSVPQDAAVNVKRIPAELAGLRREYLQALQANLAARKEYHSLTEKIASAKERTKGSKTESPSIDPSSELQTYLRLLRDRRRHAKLQVFQHYLHELKERDSDISERIGDRASQGQQIVSLEETEEECKPTGRGADDGIEGLVHKLERAVIRAKAQLDRERSLLDGLKSQLASDSTDVPPAVKVAALQRTRDELVQWVEEKLVSVGNADDAPVHDLSPEEIEESTRSVEDQKAEIAAQYIAYVEARKRLLDAASRACQPLTMPSTKPSRQSVDLGKLAIGDRSSLDPLEVLSFTSENILPLSKAQRALALQKNYLSGLLTKQRSMTLRILNRLSDESHLLPEYPLLTLQPRFKHISSRHATSATGLPKPDEVVSLAESWAFASEAAATNEHQYVEERLVEGQEAATDAEHVLQEVYNMLNQDLEETLRDPQSSEEDLNDIWASEARSTWSRTRGTRSQKQPRGPWAKLNGQLGITE